MSNVMEFERIHVIPRNPNIYLRKNVWIELMKFCMNKKYIGRDGKIMYMKAINDLLEYAFRKMKSDLDFEVIGVERT